MSEGTGPSELTPKISGVLSLGKTVMDHADVTLPLQALKRHVMALGGSGSGKTVLCKCVIEEAVRNNIPVLIVDPQGDISSLAIKGDSNELIRRGTSLDVQEDFFHRARVAIFTPASNRAIPLCVNPFRSPAQDVPHEEAVQALDLTADSLGVFLGYDLSSDSGKSAKAYIFAILEYSWQHGQRIGDIPQLADLVLNPPQELVPTLNSLVAKNEPEEIARKLRFLTVGTQALMFQMGTQIDIDLFKDRSDGKVPVNIIYLNTLTSENDKQFFLAILLKELYCWMLKNPSNDLQMLFYVDEISPYIPPYPRNPPPKNAYALLFKQARKYGIGLVAATQNITDIDYKALAQVNTWCLGRLMTSQDIARVQRIIQSIDPSHADAILQKLPSLRTGEFLLLSPDQCTDVVDFDVRWLATKHMTLDEKDLVLHLTSESRTFFETHAQMNPTRKWTTAAKTRPQATLEERIMQLLRLEKRTVSLDQIANSLNLGFKDFEKALSKLLRDGRVRKSRDRDSGEYVYWLPEFKFNPARGMSSEVLVGQPLINQTEAVKRVRPLLEGGTLRKDEEVYDAVFTCLPIWRINATIEKRVFLGKKDEERTYYLSGETGDLVSLEKKGIMFHKLMPNASQKLKAFDQDSRFRFTPAMPSEVDKMPQVKLNEQKACQSLELKIGARASSAELILLPIWTLKIQHKKRKTRRTINMDAVTGRVLSGSGLPSG